MPDLLVNYTLSGNVEGLLIDEALVNRISGSMTSEEIVSLGQQRLKVDLVLSLVAQGESLANAVSYVDAHVSEVH